MADKSEASTSAAAAEVEDSPSTSKGTKTEAEDSRSPETDTSSGSDGWQAIYSAEHNAYYFYNEHTHQTTWQNPRLPESHSDPTSVPSSTPSVHDAAIAQGIDPALAHLDPSLAAHPSTSPSAYAASARFNARTGQFSRPDARDPSHLSEYERAKRMSEFYFDVNAWEQQQAAGQELDAQAEVEGSGKKRKRPTKKDLVSVPSEDLSRG
jgi:hypothetical protein